MSSASMPTMTRKTALPRMRTRIDGLVVPAAGRQLHDLRSVPRLPASGRHYRGVTAAAAPAIRPPARPHRAPATHARAMVDAQRPAQRHRQAADLRQHHAQRAAMADHQRRHRIVIIEQAIQRARDAPLEVAPAFAVRRRERMRVSMEGSQCILRQVEQRLPVPPPKSSSSHSSSASTSSPRGVASAIAVCSARSRGELITCSQGCAA